MFHTMKRGYSELGENDKLDHRIALANCLVLLSQGGSYDHNTIASISNTPSSRVFECKTCNRQFPSFQALGGHRASHKRPKSTDEDRSSEDQSPAKPKMHECSFCGLEFAIGQALGGHMRRHRAEAAGLREISTQQQPPALSLLDGAPIVNKSNTSRRVFSFDLNLTPMENTDLQLIGKPAPTLHCYL